MKQQDASAQRGTARAGRWFARALLVLGGAVAGTAAAWAVSTASASADTAMPESGQQAAVQQDEHAPAVPDAADVLAGPAEFAAHLQTGDGIAHGRQTAAEVTDAVQRFAQDAVVAPVHEVVDTAVQLTRQPQDAPRVIGQALTPPQDFLHLLRPSGGELIKLPLPGIPGAGEREPAAAPAAPAVAAPPVLPAEPFGPVALVLPGAHSIAQHADDYGLADGGSHADRHDRFPYSPERGPLAPSGVPFAPGGSAAGGHVDGQLLGVPAGVQPFADAHAVRAVRFGIRHTPVQPGEQPGVTPD